MYNIIKKNRYDIESSNHNLINYVFTICRNILNTYLFIIKDSLFFIQFVSNFSIRFCNFILMI